MTVNGFKTATDFGCVTVIRARTDFIALRNGRRWSTSTLILQSLTRADLDSNCRVGYTVTKKVGNAIVRNRIKRRLREAVRQSFPGHALLGHDYALIAKQRALNADFSKIVQDLKTALDRVHSNGQKPAKH